MVHLEYDFYFLAAHSLLLPRNESIRKSNIRLNFVKKTSSMLYHVKRYLKIKSSNPKNTTDVESYRSSISFNRQKIGSRTRKISKKRVTS